MKTYRLNINKRDNFMFIDPVSGLCLDLIKQVGKVQEPTPGIIKAVETGKIIDITKEEVKTNIDLDNIPSEKVKCEEPVAKEKPKKTRAKKKE